jgi:hypothetical protein
MNINIHYIIYITIIYKKRAISSMRFGFFFQFPSVFFRPKRVRIKQRHLTRYRKLLLQHKKLSDNLKKSKAANVRCMSHCAELKAQLTNSEVEYTKLFDQAEGLQSDVENWEKFCDAVHHERSRRRKQRKLLRAERNTAIAERDSTIAELAETQRQLALSQHNYNVICDVLSTSTIVLL